MVPEMQNDVEKRWLTGPLEAFRVLVRFGPQILLLFLFLLMVFNLFLPRYFSPRWIFEAPLLLLVMNTVFSIMPFAFAAIALRGYLADGSTILLFSGSGMLALGSASLVSGWLGAQIDANTNLTIHNTGVLLASIFQFIGGLASLFRRSARGGKEQGSKSAAVSAYAGVIVLIFALSLAALYGYTPPFNGVTSRS